MTTTTAETWWAAFSKREQSCRKNELARELDTRGMDIPDSDYGWANAPSCGLAGPKLHIWASLGTIHEHSDS